MSRGKFNEKQMKFNKLQMEKIKQYSTIGLSKQTGIPESQCYFIRMNNPKDYQVSTLARLANGLGMTLPRFLELGADPVMMDTEILLYPMNVPYNVPKAKVHDVVVLVDEANNQYVQAEILQSNTNMQGEWRYRVMKDIRPFAFGDEDIIDKL